LPLIHEPVPSQCADGTEPEWTVNDLAHQGGLQDRRPHAQGLRRQERRERDASPDVPPAEFVQSGNEINPRYPVGEKRGGGGGGLAFKPSSAMRTTATSSNHCALASGPRSYRLYRKNHSPHSGARARQGDLFV